jgi:hypothetical protein
VNFNAPDFLSDLENTKDKLDGGVSLDQIQSALDIPELSEFSKLAQGLLPENLIKSDANGKLGLPTLTELQQSLYSGLTDIKGYLEKEITGVFDSLIGEVRGVYDEAKSVYNDLTNAVSSIQKDSSTVADIGLAALNNATGLNITAQSVGNLQKSISNSIESFTTLSPKKIKDLADPNFYGRMVDATLNNTLDAAGKNAELAGLEGILNDQIDSSAYVSMFKSSIESGKNVLPKQKESDDTQYKVVVKRTVYWGAGEGATPEGAAKKANTGNKLVDDYSLLVDNSKIIVGSKVKFDDDKKEREAVDVATPSKGVSISGEYPTIAIYFDKKEKAQAYTKVHPNSVINAIVTVPSQKDNDKKQKTKEKAKVKKEELKKAEKPTKAELEAKLAALEKRKAELESQGVTAE